MTSPCVFAENPDSLTSIGATGVQLVVVDRPVIGQTLVDEAEIASFGPLDVDRDVPARRDQGDHVPIFPELAGMSFARELERDIRDLCERFARVASRDSVHVSLQILHHDGCCKWHVDRVGLRLLSTYCGPATEWALPGGVDRTALGCSCGSIEEANARIVFDERAIRRAGPGQLLLCKGDAFPGEEGRGLVHRSPPLAGSGRWRLLLRIDELGLA